jgi:hypothetical protein
MTDVQGLPGEPGSHRPRYRPRYASAHSLPLRRVALAAAAAASAVVLSLTACTASGPSPAERVAVVASGSASRSPAAPPSPAAAPETVPEYYAETTAARAPAYDNPDNITIRDTYTAAVLATVRPPRPYQTFGYVFAAGQPDTWVAGAQPWHPLRLDNSAQPVTLFTLTFDPATRQVTLTRLPATPVPGSDLGAVALSPDGTRLAEVVLVPGRLIKLAVGTEQPGVVRLRVYTTANGTVTASSRELADSGNLAVGTGYSLTWLNDNRTLAIGGPLGSISTLISPSTVLYLDTATPGEDRTVRLSFPPAGKVTFDGATATPDRCSGAPIATSDGQDIVCGGSAATPANFGGALNVGIWTFSARTGKLTRAWDRHQICCALSETVFPRVIWASPTGSIIIATGITQANQGASLDVRTPGGQLRQLPWLGLISYPELVNIVEPSVAW